MGKISLFPSLTLSTLAVKEVTGGSKDLHVKLSKYKCWSLAAGCGGHCSTEGEAAGGVGFVPLRLYNRDPECHILALQASPQKGDRRATLPWRTRWRPGRRVYTALSPGHQWYRLSVTHAAEARCSLVPLPLKTEDFCS